MNDINVRGCGSIHVDICSTNEKFFGENKAIREELPPYNVNTEKMSGVQLCRISKECPSYKRSERIESSSNEHFAMETELE